MSASFGNGNDSQEVDLNITPIIDCFTVLITFLLASASFLSIGFFEAYTPGSNASPSQTEPDTELVIRVKSNHIAEFKLKGKRNDTLRFDLNQKDISKNIDAEITNLKSPQIKLSQILVSADDDVDYKTLSLLMDYINKSDLPIVVGEF